MRLTVLLLLALGAGCATNSVGSTNRYTTQGLVLPNSMCARQGVAASNDSKGDRLLCEFEELTGSHVPKCVCRDEQEILAQREDAQQFIRDTEHGRCSSNGGGTCH